MSTPAAALPPPPPIPPARTLSDEAVDLATYRIVERVSDRFNKRATFWFTVIGIVSALVVFVGLDAIKASVTRTVEDVVKTDVEKEIAPLTDRERKELVDNEIATAMIKKQNADAQVKLDTVNQALAKMDELSVSTAKLNKDLKTLNERLTAATEQTNRAINGLRTAQQNLAAGRPSIFSWSFALKQGGIIEGANFGDTAGSLSIRVAYRHELTIDMTYLPPLAYTDWIPIDAHSITKWSNTRITLQFSDAFQERYRTEVAKLKLGVDSPGNLPPEVSNYRIQTKTGAFNEVQ
jgi:uncharacterized protein YoxC